ncbi:MAG: cytochrome c oxidase cbb3-type subunit 4 [Psychromonas sp.]|jgi:cytochrome c oxidase cbb3-type subunit 4|uniref:cbb3-type cytochrome oxidase subunit 3 n=1 Tax=Psychromonas sp. TaxID=1884585 RepID=UPI0039E4AD73
MDFATFNGLYTLFLIVIFVALILWAYSKKQKKAFDDIANSIFDEDQDTIKYEDRLGQHTEDKK